MIALRGKVSLLALTTMTTACADIADPGEGRHRILMDVRSLTGAALGDGASVVQEVELFVTQNVDIVVLHLTQTLTPTDSIAEFDVELDPGTYEFSVFVRSNTDVLLFFGDTRARVPEAFPVVIVPQPTAAVMVVSPRAGTAQQPVVVRNAGSDTLLWSVDCVRFASGDCIAGGQFVFPSRGTLAPGGAQTLEDAFSTGEWQLTFVSPEGEVTVSTSR